MANARCPYILQDIVALNHNAKGYSLVQLLFCREILEMVRKMIQRGWSKWQDITLRRYFGKLGIYAGTCLSIAKDLIPSIS